GMPKHRQGAVARGAAASAPAANAAAAAATTAPETAAGEAISDPGRQEFFFRQVAGRRREDEAQDVVGTLRIGRLGHAHADLALCLDAVFPEDDLGVGQEPILEVLVGPRPGDDPAPGLARNP